MKSICYKRNMSRNRALEIGVYAPQEGTKKRALKGCLSPSLTSSPICDSDKYRPASSHFYSFFFVFLIVLSLFYSSVCAEEQPQFYTIQAGSYAGEQGALHQYQELADILPESQRAFLRVEKVGRYYTVRVGKFENRDESVDFVTQAEQNLSNVIILQAYI